MAFLETTCIHVNHLLKRMISCNRVAFTSHRVLALCRPKQRAFLHFLRIQHSTFMTDNSGADKKEKKSYHKKATGDALKTVEKRSTENDLKLYGSCFWYEDYIQSLRGNNI